MRVATLFLSSPPFSLRLTLTITPLLFFHSPPPLAFPTPKLRPPLIPLFPSPNSPFVVQANDDDGHSGGPDDYDMDDKELEKVDNKKDFDFEYDSLAAGMSASVVVSVDEDIAMVQSKNFVSTQGWDSEMVVDYRINKEEFHKISLFHYDFFIRKPPDPNNNVYDFREVLSFLYCELL